MNQGNPITEKQKEQNEYTNASRYIMYLLKGALNQTVLRNLPTDCTWGVIWEIANRNCIEALIGNYIQKYGEIVPAEIRDTGKKIYNEMLYRQIRFDMEYEKVARELENQKLAYLILKGTNISRYYPEASTRWMSDYDILCAYIQQDQNGGYREKGETDEEIQYWKEKTCDAIQSAMKKCGYSLKQSGGCHNTYIKQSMFKFEMHYQLFSDSFDKAKAQYYQNPWKRAIPDEQRPYLYHYSKEDEYLYIVTHAYKHFSRSGSGIRTLIDVYLYIKNNMLMDWDYISAQLKILELEKFEELLRNAAIHAFSVEGEMTKEEWDTVFYMIGSGVYGTSQNRIRHFMKELDEKNNKNKVWCYIKDRVWLNENMIKEYFPFFYRHRILRPVMPLYRIIRGLLIHPKKIWREWRILSQTVQNDK